MAHSNGMSEQVPGVRTFILAGGLGMRLRTLSGARPKGMMPVGGQPFLERLIVRLAEQRQTDIILCRERPNAYPDKKAGIRCIRPYAGPFSLLLQWAAR